MDKAFDSILYCEIDAITLANNAVHKASGYFRYQCLCCGEEVYLAAADSTTKAPHFRHRRGNNDKECERYLGQHGALEKSIFERKRNQEQVYFFFNNDRKTVEIGIAFNIDELEELKTQQALIKLKSKYYERTFLTVPVSDASFIPNTMKYFTINEYSQNYYLSIAGKVCSFDNIIERKGKITFFRLRIQDKRAKKVFSDFLYTGTMYIAICEEESCIAKLVSNINVECANGLFKFATMGKSFWGAEITINRSDYDLNLMLLEQNLHIETAETLSVLWPPVFLADSEYLCESDKIYVKSSFPLIQQDNTNEFCNTDDLPIGITQINLEERAVIFEKNIELTLIKVEADYCEFTQYEVESICSSKWETIEDMDYYLFDQDGCRKLSVGQSVYLTEQDRIVGYRNGRVQKVVSNNKKSVLTAQQIIEDIQKYHPQSENYNSDDFSDSYASELVISYLEECHRNCRINTVVKKYIEEGLL